MMLSQIRLGNSIASNDLKREKGSLGNIKGFSLKDFFLMEREYEHSSFKHPYFANTQEKLANICCNILANGNFDIHDDTDYLIN